MAEHAATALGLTPVVGNWRDVLSASLGYLRQHHEPYPTPPKEGRLLVVDRAQRRITGASPIELSASAGREHEGAEYWRSVTVELWFGGHSDDVMIRVREAEPTQTHVELWFSSRVHDAVFSFDPDSRTLDPQAKSDLVRLMIGLAKTLGAAGFGYQFAKEDSVFGPPRMEVLRDYVEGEYRSHAHEPNMLTLAGLAASEVREEQFVYDVDDPMPLHYRQNGYYLCDLLWPS
jgi:hypothetical protein